MARPPLPDSERRSCVIVSRVTEAEKALIDKGAIAEGKTSAEFVRDAAVERASKALTKGKRRR